MKESLFIVMRAGSFALIFFLLTATARSQSDQQSNKLTYTGTVIDSNEGAIANAHIQLKGSFLATTTNSNGEFELQATPGETLVISAFLRLSQEVTLGEETNIPIQLQTDVQLLEEVVLWQKVKAQEEMINTPFGKKKKQVVGYAMKTITSEDFWPGDINLRQALFRHPLIVGNLNDGPLFFTRNLRGMMTPTPIQIILDGAPVTQNILLTIDPNSIKRITLVPGLAGNIKWGFLGNGGTAYVYTKLGDFSVDEQEAPPSLLAKNNDFTEALPSLEDIETELALMGELTASGTLQDAKATYQRHTRELGMRSLDYYLQAAEYFSGRDLMYSHNILSQLITLCADNPNVLLRLAYQCEQMGRFQQAAYVYEELMQLRPGHVQSYLDLAQIYTEIGHYKTANTLYRQMLFNNVPTVDFTAVESIVIADYRRFLSKYRSKVNFKGLPNELLIPIKKRSTRLVFEWTNPLSEFEIQFVSPDKKFYNWTHTAFENKEVIQREVEDGFATKDFTIDDVAGGEWMINIKPLGDNDNEIPSFIKYTVYRNYGLADETIQTKIVSLNRIDQKVTLDAILE